MTVALLSNRSESRRPPKNVVANLETASCSHLTSGRTSVSPVYCGNHYVRIRLEVGIWMLSLVQHYYDVFLRDVNHE